MAEFGYTMMCEQAPARQLVRDVTGAEAAGYDFAVVSDHYFPWLESQGHSPYAFSVLGAAAQATHCIPLMTYVTCPILRYHPVVVAQKAATVQELSGGRFSLGLGAGENLNEHVVGKGWPSVSVRHEMLEEAVRHTTTTPAQPPMAGNAGAVPQEQPPVPPVPPVPGRPDPTDPGRPGGPTDPGGPGGPPLPEPIPPGPPEPTPIDVPEPTPIDVPEPAPLA